MSFIPGDITEVFRNQGYRECMILAVLGDKAIGEYEMPAGTTALLIGPNDECDFDDKSKSISYSRVSMKWRKAIADQVGNWSGRGQTQPCKTVYHYGRRRPSVVITPAPLFPDVA